MSRRISARVPLTEAFVSGIIRENKRKIEMWWAFIKNSADKHRQCQKLNISDVCRPTLKKPKRKYEEIGRHWTNNGCFLHSWTSCVFRVSHNRPEMSWRVSNIPQLIISHSVIIHHRLFSSSREVTACIINSGIMYIYTRNAPIYRPIV